jgi:hypothetical protein
MALYTTSPTQQALSPMEQLLQIKKKTQKTGMPTLLTPEEQQTNMGTMITPGATPITPETQQIQQEPQTKTPMEQLAQTKAISTSIPPIQQPPAGPGNVPMGSTAPPPVNAQTSNTVATKPIPSKVYSDKAWEIVNSNTDWLGTTPDARRVGEGDQAWHDRLLANYKASFTPEMETKYDDNGRPVEVGYYDWGGNWVQTRDMGALNNAMTALTDAANAVPNLIDVQGTPEYQRLTDLQAQLNDPNATQADMDAAEAQAAAEMGISVPDLRARLAQMREQSNLGVNAQQGMTQQEITEYDRKTALERQDLMRQGQELMQQVMGKSGGSAIAAGNARNAIISTLATFQAQKDAQQTELDWNKKSAEYAALVARNDQLFQQKEITAGRYLDAMKENRTIALQATFAQLNALAQQNQAEIDKYSAIASVRYQEVMAQLGVMQGVSEQELNDYEKTIAPLRFQMEQAALKAQQDQQNVTNILGVIGLGISLIAAIPTGGASLVGAGAGLGTLVGSQVGKG